jgi:hypothetical protein
MEVREIKSGFPSGPKRVLVDVGTWGRAYSASIDQAPWAATAPAYFTILHALIAMSPPLSPCRPGKMSDTLRSAYKAASRPKLNNAASSSRGENMLLKQILASSRACARDAKHITAERSGKGGDGSTVFRRKTRDRVSKSHVG